MKRLFKRDEDGCFMFEQVIAWAIIASPVLWMICHF